MNIGIVGMGVVGQAIYQNYLEHGHSVISFDVKNRDSKLQTLLDAESIFVCVPTDTLNDNTCDISSVDQTLFELYNLCYKGLIIIKSTMLPGSTHMFCKKYPRLKICFVPEFLRQDHAKQDYLDQQRNLIVGCDRDDLFEIVKYVHQDFSQSFMRLTATEAEFVKYFVNTFNSLRIVFANAFYESCTQQGADYSKVLDCAISRNVIANDSYLKCSENLRGFGGKCLPKDTQSFTAFLARSNIPHSLFQSILDDNNHYVKQ